MFCQGKRRLGLYALKSRPQLEISCPISSLGKRCGDVSSPIKQDEWDLLTRQPCQRGHCNGTVAGEQYDAGRQIAVARNEADLSAGLRVVSEPMTHDKRVAIYAHQSTVPSKSQADRSISRSHRVGNGFPIRAALSPQSILRI